MTQPAAPQTVAGFFAGGGGKSFSWKDKPIGTTVSGVIKTVHPPQQATDPVDGSPAIVKKTGKPKIQVRIDLQTNERDPLDPEDDGVRGVYVGGWMTGAVGDALRKAGATEPQVGGTLTVRLTEREPNPGLNPTNKFDAHYVPAPVTAGFFEGGGQAAAPGGLAPLGGQAAPPAPQPNISGQGYVQPPAAPAQAGGPLTPEQIAAMLAQPGPAPAAPIAEPEPERPPQMNEAAWAALDLAAKKQIAATFAGLPPF